jgi:biotin-(acetyl-CoA carboxylase) ligase
VNCLQNELHFPPEIHGSATSLELESSQPVDRVSVGRAILRILDGFFAEGSAVNDEQLVAAWRECSADLGQHVTLLTEGRHCSGRIVDIHPMTGLLLQLDDGGRRHFDPSTATRV